MEENWNELHDPKYSDLTCDAAPKEISDNASLTSAWEDRSGERHLLLYTTTGEASRAWVVRSFSIYKGAFVVYSTNSLSEARAFISGLRTGWDGISAHRTSKDEPPRPSETELCPYCGARDCLSTPDEMSSSGMTDDNRLKFNYVCDQCGGLFASMAQDAKELPYDNWTLMFVPEKDDENRITDIKAVKLVKCGDPDDAGVMVARAEYNAKFGGCSEVHGRDWAIRNLFQLISEHYDFDIEESGKDVRAWLPGYNENGEHTEDNQ